MNPLISVIVPCYNQAQYLDECLQSVLDQTYCDWECIIVNDGSPDETAAVAMKWLERDQRFKYIEKENGGLSSARNAGIKIANGEWILPLDADDKIGDQYFEFAAQEFASGYTLIYCDAEFFGTKSGKWHLPPYNFKNILTNNMIFCSGFFKKSDWQRVSGYDGKLRDGREDWDLWLSLLTNESKVKRITYTGFFYRQKENSMDVALNKNKDKLYDIDFYIFSKHWKKYKNEFNSPLEILRSTLKNERQLQQAATENNLLLKRIRKNFLTKLLFSLIEKL